MIKQDVEIVLWQVMKEAMTPSEYEGKESLMGVSTRECTQNRRSHQLNTDSGKGSHFARPATDVHSRGEPDCQVSHCDNSSFQSELTTEFHVIK